MTVSVLARGWRPALQDLLSIARRRVLLASPYIKQAEAEWLCSRLNPGVSVSVLTDVSTASVEGGSLDHEALMRFASLDSPSEVITLGRLHAKVFVADDSAAVVTSGNLTTAGLDLNFEYGLRADDSRIVTSIVDDLTAYARLGNRLDAAALDALRPVWSELREANQGIRDSASMAARRRFRHALDDARQQFAAAQVGARSANAIFSEAILLALRDGPMATARLAERVRRLLPADLCDDTTELVINGERYGKAWKHTLRNAQQSLKNQGRIEYQPQGRLWSLVGA